MIEHEDIKKIEREILEICDEKYVKVPDCAEIHQRINQDMAAYDKRIEVIHHDFNNIKWLIATGVSATFGQLIISIFGRIF